MQIRSRDHSRLKKLFLETATLFRVSSFFFFAGCIMLRPFNISLLCLVFFRYLKATAATGLHSLRISCSIHLKSMKWLLGSNPLPKRQVRKVKNGEKSPWEQRLTRPVPNGRRRSGFWLVPEKHIRKHYQIEMKRWIKVKNVLVIWLFFFSKRRLKRGKFPQFDCPFMSVY